jgi:hypothetical protein
MGCTAGTEPPLTALSRRGASRDPDVSVPACTERDDSCAYAAAVDIALPRLSSTNATEPSGNHICTACWNTEGSCSPKEAGGASRTVNVGDALLPIR